MKIAVIDGQGGGIGRSLIEKIKGKGDFKIIALGTNTLATGNMLKAGASNGATGENAIVFNSSRVDIIMGPIGIITANSMLGELTPKMAQAISESSAKKILIPFNKCNIYITGVTDESLQNHLESAVQKLLSF
ncbi:DUF3842 family protein [Serpentinicella alkaliphila]|uniref:Uncharacterized protein DUF3842 n=1 Tax=Serpentinicella alkaliphila TaxID=1734049 RepID=A0A4R2TEM0_9FIRM|nr:DUF3842 family protein [Serpentinicella alkaliphila]QUH27029.1 DUF3842 family protein [Serpentinicella alkaliphila]TCP95628.1 uncharacterized protein DUF3842 [Serpentinicella alkaliphila]